MAVYTKITLEDIAVIPNTVNLENISGLTPITSGIENTNYFIETDSKRYVLTLFEDRTPADALPFFVALMRHMSAHGLPCPDVLTDVFTLKNKPAIVASFLDGKSADVIDPTLCYQVGRMLAAMHLAADNFTLTRNSTLPPSRWRELIDAVADQAEETYLGMVSILRDEIAAFEKLDVEELPQGAIHADLFPDNVFFNDGRLSGVIDFYYAFTGPFVYDLMLTLNAWCGQDFEKISALRRGYESLRTLTAAEKKLLPQFGKAAAVRITATRLFDWFQDKSGADVVKKDPMEHFRVLENYRAWDDMRG